MSIHLSYRITLQILIQGKQLIPVDIGDHDAVFGLWGDRGETALDLERALREEWSR